MLSASGRLWGRTQEEVEEPNSLYCCFTRTRVKILTQQALLGRVLGRAREEVEEKNALLLKELAQASKQTQQLAQQVCSLCSPAPAPCASVFVRLYQ